MTLLDPNWASEPRILVVDDESSICKSICRLLRGENYSIQTANSGEQALAIVDDFLPEVVLSDYRMPGMLGTEFLSKVAEKFPDTIRMVLSGYSEVTAIIDAINKGAVYKYLTKPWVDDDLRLNIRRAVECYQLMKDNKSMAQKLEFQNKLLAVRYDDAELGRDFSQRLLESIDAAVLCVDSLGVVVYANGSACEVFSKNNSELIGLSADTVVVDQVFAALDSGQWSGCVNLNGEDFDWRVKRLVGNDCERGYILTAFRQVGVVRGKCA